MNRRKPEHRRGQPLFIDARAMGTLVSRVQRTLSDAEIRRIAGTYRNWRTGVGGHADVPGFCKGATLDEIAGHGYVLTPGRYMGAAAMDDSEPFAERMSAIVHVRFLAGDR